MNREIVAGRATCLSCKTRSYSIATRASGVSTSVCRPVASCVMVDCRTPPAETPVNRRSRSELYCVTQVPG